MKKLLSVVVAAFLAVGSLTACSSAGANGKNKIKIVTTIFPEYDWVMNVLGENPAGAEVTMLLDNGVDLHSFQPTATDIMKISSCDLFVYVGGESDDWVEDALKEATNKDMVVINLLDVLGDKVKEEEVVEGMQEGEHHHDHEGGEEDHDHEHSHEEEKEITEADIKPREVSEFAGEWQSLYPVLMTGALDEYVKYQAEKKSITVEESRAQIEAKWNCGVKTIKIEGNSITLYYDDGTKATGTYEYAGFATKKDDTGKITSIRHEFLRTSGDGPKYVMLNDHGHEPADSVEHFHIYFGDNNFDELVTTTSNPFFVDAKLDAKGCLDNVMGHEQGHDHSSQETEADHDHEHDHEHHHEEGEIEYDEHVWLSLRNAQVLVQSISDAMQKIDSANAATYKKNSDSYIESLKSLDNDYKAVVDAASNKTILFGDRFPFRYMVDDYGLTYYAAFVGCSAESEASFETITFLSKKVDELKLPVVLTIEGKDHRIAETIVQNTASKDQKIMTLDSMQSASTADYKGGTTYLSIMKANLSVLTEALK
ncbi:MAG: zinc ABC transporter substrate-binding protein [Saccharofermentans sp.]|nr:zinc ABC transporter substrate-binding protein [Saccharofermentans sp.]